MTRFLGSTLSLVLGIAACGDNDPSAESPDATPSADAAPSPDSATGPDSGGCDPATALPQQWRPIDKVAAGAVTSTRAGAVTTAVIDATAGGLQGAADNPYVYVDLATGAKVAISDVDALTSSAWHIALKRANLRANGGDSGPAGVTVAAVAAASLDEVTAAPADRELTADDWATADCAYVPLPAGEPATRMGEWYDYDEVKHQVVPKAQVYVLRVSGGATYKLRILTFYGDAANPTRSAVYRLEWAPL